MAEAPPSQSPGLVDRDATAALADAPAGSFDFSQIREEHRLDLQHCQTTIRRVTAETVFVIGRELLRAKGILKDQYPRGTWSEWLDKGVGMAESTARNMMAATEWVHKSPTVGVLLPGALYKGAVAPAAVQAEIERRLSVGGSISADEITALVKVHREAALRPNPLAPVEGASHGPAQALRSHPNYSDYLSGDANELWTDEVDAVASLKSTVPPTGRRGEITRPAEDDETKTITNVAPRAEAADGEPEPEEQGQAEVWPTARPTHEAATELIADLRSLLDDDRIRKLIELWRQTTPEALLLVLNVSSRAGSERPDSGLAFR